MLRPVSGLHRPCSATGTPVRRVRPFPTIGDLSGLLSRKLTNWLVKYYSFSSCATLPWKFHNRPPAARTHLPGLPAPPSSTLVVERRPVPDSNSLNSDLQTWRLTLTY